VETTVCGSNIIHKIRIVEMFVFFNSRDELQRIDVSKIVYFEADGNYTTIVMVNKLQASVCMNLGEMESALAKQLGEESRRFMRIGKRFIINMNYVYSINVQKQQLVLSDYDHFAFRVSISKEALKKMKELMVATYIEP
jgi:DNA-binding LytR/AlgR family response regulator